MARAPSRARVWKVVRSWLYKVHRWVGIAACLLFAMWFASGVVMMYVPFPSLSERARREALPPIDWSAVKITPAEVTHALGAPPRDLLLHMRGTEPVYRAVRSDGTLSVLSARTGDMLPPVDGPQGLALVRAGRGGAEARLVETLARDQWTVPQSYDPHRPLHLVALEDAAGTRLHVSSRTGEIVLRTTRAERFWNWLGAVPHWIYVTPLRQNGTLWANVVLWISGLSLAVAVTGLWIGLLRAKLGRTRYAGGRVSPYRGWMLWHHVAGLAGGLAVLTFLFSGWMSLNPGNAFARSPLSPAQMAAFEGADGWAFPGDPAQIAPRTLPQAVEARVTWFAGRPLLLLADGHSRLALVDAEGSPVVLSDADIAAAAPLLRPGTPILQVTRLTEADAYWYSHHRERPLPVVRIVFGDAQQSWVHVDPATGRIVGSSTASLRLYRWLYNGLHSLDLPLLLRHRPVWDGVMLVLCAAGMIISVSGIVIGWRRITRRKPAARRPEAGSAS